MAELVIIMLLVLLIHFALMIRRRKEWGIMRRNWGVGVGVGGWLALGERAAPSSSSNSTHKKTQKVHIPK